MSRLVRSRSTLTSKEVEEENRIGNDPNIYQIGAEIGRGGFGVVFQAFNVRTGDFVAVKRFPLNSIDKESLSSIESEIELMQKLNHPNIVKYFDTIRTKSHLYIVLEYMENGSLANVIKKFGFFSESLTAIYVTQVLRGLRYLHEQGVLHRDIKGANILTTKDGMVKLADFGVAIKLSEANADEQDVVGSPYWIAPEIIEMSAPTAACDIWSVGCIIIELLTGKPPYFDLEPMAALFRIVQDDYPPFPDGISQALRDFLLNCFQKEPVMRNSATKLLEHPWLYNSSTNSKLEEQKNKLSRPNTSTKAAELEEGDIAPETHSIMNTIKMYQREVSPASDLASISMDGIASVKRTSSADQREEGFGVRQVRSMDRPTAGLKVSPSKKLLATPSIQATRLCIVSATDSLSIASSGNSAASSKNGAEAINSDILARRGLVKHEGPHATPPVDPTRSMSPISDSTAATKDNNRIEHVLNHSGFDDEDASPLPANTNSSFFNTMKLDSDDSDENWDDAMVIDKAVSQSVDSFNGSSEKYLSKQATPKGQLNSIFRQGSHSSNTSEQNSDRHISINLRNRSVDLVAKLKSSSLSVPSAPSFLFSEGKRELRSSSNNNNVLLNPTNAQSLLTKFQEDDEDANFDEFGPAEGSQSKANTKAPRVRSQRGFTKHKSNSGDNFGDDLYRIDTFDSSLLTSSDTQEWQTKDMRHKESEHLALLPGSSSQVVKFQVHHLQQIKESSEAVRILSADDDFDDLEFEGDDVEGLIENGQNNFALSLRAKLQTLGKASSLIEEEDEFMNVQFDEKDFKQNEQKDIHSRRSKEVVDLLNRMRITSKESDITAASQEVIQIFERFPEQREHFISSHGLMPIIDMFESQSSLIEYYTSTHGQASSNNQLSSHSSTISANSSNYATYVLQIVNKIIEGSIRASEQLSLMGIIPIVMSLFERSARNSTPKIPPAALFFSTTPHYSSVSHSSAEKVTPRAAHSTEPNAFFSRADTIASAISEDDFQSPSHNIGTIDTVTMEAAKFIHQISLSSSITLQMLIGAGGLTVLTTMVSYAASIGKVPHSQFRSTDSSDFAELEAVNENGVGGGIQGLSSSLPSGLLDLKVTISAPATLLTEEAIKAMGIFQMGMDCIAQLFSVQSSRTRDFCRLFVKLGLLSHLSIGFSNLRAMYYTMMRANYNTAETSRSDVDKTDNDHSINPTSSRSTGHKRNDSIISVADSFLTHDSVVQYNAQADDTPERIYCHMIATLFSKFSRSDSIVAETMASVNKGVIKTILETLQMAELQASSPHGTTVALHSVTPFSSRKHIKVTTLSPAYLEMLELCLKCLKNLSMEPSALDNLEKAGTIETLVPLLSGPLSDRYIIYILPCIFNMCRINKRRQEMAALLGIIPHLKKIIAEGSHLRQFALPILFDFAHTSNATRMHLWKLDCVSFYVNLLKENYWQGFALNSLAVWISSDAVNVSSVLVQPVCLSRLIDFFEKVSSQTLHSLHKPLLDIMSKSNDLSSALSYSGIFISALVRRLKSPQEAIVLRTLLKMLQLLHQHHASPRQLVLDHDLYSIVKEFARSETQVLVCQIANRLLIDFQTSTLT